MNTSNLKTAIAAASMLTMFAGVGLAQEQSGRHRACSNATLLGGFGYTSTGTLLEAFVPPPLAGPFAEIGRQTFDGKGNTDATATLSANGNIVQNVIIQGTYTVNPDCSGSMTLEIPQLEATVHADLVIDDDGAEIRAIVTDANVIESRVYKKQF